jgi:hypothetical protein
LFDGGDFGGDVGCDGVGQRGGVEPGQDPADPVGPLGYIAVGDLQFAGVGGEIR